MGIEPTSKAWEAFVLPLNYTRERIRFYDNCAGLLNAITITSRATTEYLPLRNTVIAVGTCTTIATIAARRTCFLPLGALHAKTGS